MLERLADWHKRTLAQVQQQLGLTTYQMHFFAFAEGIIFGLIIGWLIFLGRHMITAFWPDIFGQITLACAGYFFLAVLRKSSRCGITALACASKPS